MRIVDFHTFPDGSEQRNALLDAAEHLDLGELTTVAPVADDAPIAFAFPDTWSDQEIEERAAELAEELADQIDGDAAVRFELGDADSSSASVDHAE